VKILVMTNRKKVTDEDPTHVLYFTTPTERLSDARRDRCRRADSIARATRTSTCGRSRTRTRRAMGGHSMIRFHRTYVEGH